MAKGVACARADMGTLARGVLVGRGEKRNGVGYARWVVKNSGEKGGVNLASSWVKAQMRYDPWINVLLVSHCRIDRYSMTLRVASYVSLIAITLYNRLTTI